MAKEARTIHPQRFFGAVVDELPNSDLTKLSISVFEYYKAGVRHIPQSLVLRILVSLHFKIHCVDDRLSTLNSHAGFEKCNLKNYDLISSYLFNS